MIYDPTRCTWRPMTKRERKLRDLKLAERARERQAARAAREAAEIAKRRASWDRMRADIAARYAA